VQLTWRDNYAKYGLEKTPDKALEWESSLFVLFDGMIKGLFTGKKLDDYINDNKRDYINARRIINGTDRAKEIAQIADAYRTALIAAQDPVAPPEDDDLQARFNQMLAVALTSDPQIQDLVRQIRRR
jgi:hypothetical protein